MLHYVDLAAAAAQPINGDLLRVIHKYIEVCPIYVEIRLFEIIVLQLNSHYIMINMSRVHNDLLINGENS